MTMSDGRKEQALAAWRKLLEDPEIRMDIEDQYDELLKMADTMEQEGLITATEWRQLVRKAGARFAQAIEGLSGGT
ncbi:GTP-binding protein [Pseudomonas serboccidentalis]